LPGLISPRLELKVIGKLAATTATAERLAENAFWI
jgi:hypothetical protein